MCVDFGILSGILVSVMSETSSGYDTSCCLKAIVGCVGYALPVVDALGSFVSVFGCSLLTS